MVIPNEVNNFLSSYSQEVRELALGLRTLILATLPNPQEMVDPADKVIGYGYGPGYKDLICTIILSQSGVSLGMVRGAQLPDPHRLMDGRGKVHRRVAFKSPSDLERPGLKELLGAAQLAWQQRATH